MKKRLSCGVVAMACVALITAPAVAEKDVFFSTIGTVGGGVVVGNPEVLAAPGASVTLYIWSSDDQDYNTTIGMNVTRDVDGAQFTGAEVYNPELLATVFDPPIPTGEFRWSGSPNDDIEVTADAVTSMDAVKISVPRKPSDGITVNNDGTMPPLQLFDPLYDMEAGAFLLGSVTLEVTTGAPTTLSIDQEDTALFVHSGEQIFPNFGTASIAIPEPSTLALTLALLGLLCWRRKRR